jgi:hypothetical protein
LLLVKKILRTGYAGILKMFVFNDEQLTEYWKTHTQQPLPYRNVETKPQKKTQQKVGHYHMAAPPPP